MLELLKIQNIALIDELEVEFASGLSLLTGETGSGKSIIVDSLGALTGERVRSDLIKEGKETARIEGIFSIVSSDALAAIFDESGVELTINEEAEIIVRRDLSLTGRNRIFVNDQTVTAAFLKKIGPFLVDIHGQGEQFSLLDPATHSEILDGFAKTASEQQNTSDAFAEWSRIRTELNSLRQDDAEKLRLLDILSFQVNEIKRAGLRIGETEELEEEKRRLANIEKLRNLSDEAFDLLYERDDSTISTFGRSIDKIEELGEFDSAFRDYLEGLRSAMAVIDDLAIAVRDFRNGLESSPERLAEIEERLVEISGITRKYGGSVEAALEHLADTEKRLENIEMAELREKELLAELTNRRNAYIKTAGVLSEKRRKAAVKFEKEVEAGLKAVALEKARFEVKIECPSEEDLAVENSDAAFSANGFDSVEFYFSANIGESPKPLARVASGGEASRLMLILRTVAGDTDNGKTTVFDEIDAGIGGRVAEAVGQKLKGLAESRQVLCVTHQAQVASKADRHFVVEKTMKKDRTFVTIRELTESERVEEIARMLAGEKITDAARENAKEMLAAA
ncbi:MAG: DNA repair protein RecN [Acidobacteria bacterium]|nr:DNA repair protein RecN [Acidobacteriota bacterium]